MDAPQVDKCKNLFCSSSYNTEEDIYLLLFLEPEFQGIGHHLQFFDRLLVFLRGIGIACFIDHKKLHLRNIHHHHTFRRRIVEVPQLSSVAIVGTFDMISMLTIAVGVA